jgi:hypothetical protein
VAKYLGACIANKTVRFVELVTLITVSLLAYVDERGKYIHLLNDHCSIWPRHIHLSALLFTFPSVKVR